MRARDEAGLGGENAEFVSAPTIAALAFLQDGDAEGFLLEKVEGLVDLEVRRFRVFLENLLGNLVAEGIDVCVVPQCELGGELEWLECMGEMRMLEDGSEACCATLPVDDNANTATTITSLRPSMQLRLARGLLRRFTTNSFDFISTKIGLSA